MFIKILWLFSISKIFIYTAASLAIYILPLQTQALAINLAVGTPYLKWIWANFDGINYITIARWSYSFPNYAYFPFFPFLIGRVRDFFDISRIDAGLLIPNVSLFISLFLLYKIAMLDYDNKIAFRSLVFLLFFPTSFFYGAIYADSLYLCLSLASFYTARKSNWLLAGIFGYFAGLTRLVGIFLFPVLVLEWYLEKKIKYQKLNIENLLRDFFKEKVFFLFLIPLAIVSYGIYLQINFNDFLLFQKAMAGWNQEHIVFPPQVLYRYIKIFLFSQWNFTYFVAVVEFVSTIFYLLLSLYVAKRVRISYGVLMFLTLLLPIFTGTLQSMPRYILHIFPAFIALSLLTIRSKKLFWATIGIFLVLQCVFVALFTRGYFIA